MAFVWDNSMADFQALSSFLQNDFTFYSTPVLTASKITFPQKYNSGITIRKIKKHEWDDLIEVYLDDPPIYSLDSVQKFMKNNILLDPL